MSERIWQTCPPELAEDEALGHTVLDAHQVILREQLAGDPMLSPALPIQLRALRRVEGWRIMLLLTPWMLARMLFPDDPPEIGIPPGWSAEDRREADYLILGPRVQFALLGQSQQAHLSFDPRLGHFLLQPICLNMEPYSDADAVFEEWNKVIRTRDQNMERAKRDCPLQKEVSRREFFRRFGDGDRE